MTTPTPLTQDELKTLVGQAALQYITPGDIVGVGTGSTVNKFIDALASIKGDIRAAVSSSIASTERLQAIGIPVLVVHDLLDDEVPWDEGERFARHLTAARLLTTLDLGHHGVLNDPTVLRDCLRFLKGEAIGDKVVSSPNLPYGYT